MVLFLVFCNEFLRSIKVCLFYFVELFSIIWHGERGARNGSHCTAVLPPSTAYPSPPLTYHLRLSVLILPPFGVSAPLAAFIAPNACPPSIKHRSSSSQLCRRTFTLFSHLAPFPSAPTNLSALACHLMYHPFHFHRGCRSIHRWARSGRRCLQRGPISCELMHRDHETHEDTVQYDASFRANCWLYYDDLDLSSCCKPFSPSASHISHFVHFAGVPCAAKEQCLGNTRHARSDLPQSARGCIVRPPMVRVQPGPLVRGCLGVRLSS